MNNIIILNGTSSSGKTTIAKYLQKLLDEPYCLLEMDDFMNMGSKKFPFEKVVPPIIQSMLHTLDYAQVQDQDSFHMMDLLLLNLELKIAMMLKQV